MSILQWLQDAWISAAIRESTWGYPIVSAIHVLGLAWFGGLILVEELRRLRYIGLIFILVTGALVFLSQPVRYYGSTAFRIKMLLLVMAAVNAWAFRRSRFATVLSWTIWIAIIFASRGIAFF